MNPFLGKERIITPVLDRMVRAVANLLRRFYFFGQRIKFICTYGCRLASRLYLSGKINKTKVTGQIASNISVSELPTT